jgi:hypothetical protein
MEVSSHFTRIIWHSTRDNRIERAAGERDREPCCHFIFDYGHMEPMSLREGRVQIGISERTKQEVLSAAPRDGFTAVRNTYLDPDHSIVRSLHVFHR